VNNLSKFSQGISVLAPKNDDFSSKILKNINEISTDNQSVTSQIVETTNISVKTLARGEYGYYLHTQAGSIKQLPLEKLVDSFRDPKKRR
jgi:hypothetical protein